MIDCILEDQPHHQSQPKDLHETNVNEKESYVLVDCGGPTQPPS